jgi:hypothetical protein
MLQDVPPQLLDRRTEDDPPGRQARNWIVSTTTSGLIAANGWGAVVPGILASIMVSCKHQGQRCLDLARRLWQSGDPPASPPEALPDS